MRPWLQLKLLRLLLKLLLLLRWGHLACYGMQIEVICKYEGKAAGLYQCLALHRV